jgi:hypothetical protein
MAADVLSAALCRWRTFSGETCLGFCSGAPSGKLRLLRALQHPTARVDIPLVCAALQRSPSFVLFAPATHPRAPLFGLRA